MKLENLLNIVMDISEKVNTYDVKSKPAEYYDVLHMSLSALIGDMTEEQYKTMPLPYRLAIEKLEENILTNVSNEYKQKWEEYLNTNGRFRKVNQRIVTKTKQTIGFATKTEELTT